MLVSSAPSAPLNWLKTPDWIWLKFPQTLSRLCAKSWILGNISTNNKNANPKHAKKQKIIEIKEIKFRPGTDTHDYDVKMRNVFKFLENGDKVKITLRFRGREMAHLNLGRELLERVAEDVKEMGKVENMPKMEGRQMTMMIGPNPK